ncbi:MAG: UDP-N-acetylmuramate--L-alanine ligase, partial [Planctomycetaceae bacterium]
RRKAAQLGVPQSSLIDVLAGLMATRIGVCVAGTHGKSTTAALIAWVLRRAGLSPSAFVGAGLCGCDRGGWAGAGDLFVVESCEYQRNFLQFRPKHAVILGIEPDHFGTYPDEATLQEAFAQFAANVRADGTLLIPADCPRSAAAAQSATADVLTFGVTLVSPLQAAIDAGREPNFIGSLKAGRQLTVSHGDELLTEVEMPLCGRHNAQNVLAAIAMCRCLGVPAEAVREAVATFPGIRRRFEMLGEWRGATIIGDYAHHPTAVRVTLEAARERYPGRRLWCVFQPHQFERTRRLFVDFAGALSLADVPLIAPVFAAREHADANDAAELSRNLAATVKEAGGRGWFISSLDRIHPTLQDEARPGDVVLLMGAGDIERIADEFAGRISRDHADR